MGSAGFVIETQVRMWLQLCPNVSVLFVDLLAKFERLRVNTPFADDKGVTGSPKLLVASFIRSNFRDPQSCAGHNSFHILKLSSFVCLFFFEAQPAQHTCRRFSSVSRGAL